MQFRVLGPLEVVENGRVLPLGSRKQRALLALFLLHPDEALTRDRLIDELWQGRPPPAADSTLRSYLSRLRSSLGADRLQTRPTGYALWVGPEELDASRFAQLVEEGRGTLARQRPAEAAKKLQQALRLWRGPALADFVYESFAQGEIARLDELRLLALEARVDAELALGLHTDLVGELERLVGDHPLRESFRAQLMLALYRSGRQADALASYREARRLLTEELGLEPSQTLKELERAILAHDPALEPPEVAAPEDGTEGSFVGRERELGELVRGLEDALDGNGRMFLLSGEPGIGKSRLIEELTRRVRDRGVEVLVGRCWEAGGAPAYWPWVQALRTYVERRDPQTLRAELGWGAADLAQIIPELNDLYRDLPVPPTTDAEGSRFRLFEAVVSFLRAASRTKPLLLVLDDVHAADAPSLFLLQFVAGALGDARLLVVTAYRDVDPSLREPLAGAVAQLRRQPATRSLELTGLAEADVGRFVSLATGLEPTLNLRTTLHQKTDGNPLFVGEVVRLLTTEDSLESMSETDAWRRMVPESIREVIRRRLRHLSENCRLVLVLSAVLGREFDLAALEQVSDVSGDQLLEVLDEAARERIVTDVPGQPGQMRFAHVLIRDTVYDDLAPGRRVQLHRRIGDALEELYADNLEPHLAELAHHFYESARPAVATKALDYARRAGEQSLRQLAYEDAARLFAMALRIFDTIESPDDTTRCELDLALGDAYGRAGDTARSKEMYREAARLAEELGLAEHLGRAALGYGGRLIWDVSRDDEYLSTLLERALDLLPGEDTELSVRLLARLAGGPLRDSRADSSRREALGAEALEVARRIGEPSTLAYGLQGYIGSRHTPDFPPDQAALALELIRVSLAAGDLERALDGHELHLASAIELGDIGSARADLQAMTRLAEQLNQPAQRWLVAVNRTLLALLEGRFDEAERLLTETRFGGDRTQTWSARVSHGLQLYMLRREQGRLDEVVELVRQSAHEHATYPIWRCVLVDVMTALGSDEARADFDALAADRFARLPFDEEWEVSLCLLAEAAARLDDPLQAEVLYELLLPYADRIAVSYPEISVGPVARFLAILASTVGRDQEAERHSLDAIALSARIGARPSLAHSQLDYARALIGRGDDGGAAKAIAAALTTYEDLGMDFHAARARALSGVGR